MALAGLIYLVVAVALRQAAGQWINDHQSSGYLKGSGNMPDTQQGGSVEKKTYTGYNQHEPVRDTGPIRTEEQEKLLDGQGGEDNK